VPHVRLGSRFVDASGPAYLIAEVGVNHEGSLEKAKALVDAAHRGGADAVKFQTYKADTLAMRDSPAYWDTSKEPTASQHELFAKYDALGADDYADLARYCEAVGIDFVSTPFDLQAVDDLAPLVPYFKIASADITNIPLIRRVAATGKPVVLSTGAASLDEISRAVDWVEAAGGGDVVLLQCVLSYPTADDGACLRVISDLMRHFPDHVIGLSDHTVPDGSGTPLVAAYALGAVVIEKHFTLDRSLPGNDHYHALDEQWLASSVADLKRAHRLMQGAASKEPTADEAAARVFARRSIVARTTIPAGTVLTENMLICKRPGTGIGPEHWDDVVGATTTSDLEEDHALTWDALGRSGT
jgi:sialic acid synthase SpsE